MVDIDGVVGGLGELVQDAHLAAALGGGGEHRHAELLLGHRLRAREGEQHSPTLYLAESLGVEASVAHEGVLQRALMLGERRRVENN